jgi:hypothetical protein
MRKRLRWILGAGAVFAIAIASVAVAAKPTIVRAGNLIVKLNGEVLPKALPKKELAPITLKLSAGIETSDGTHPPAVKTFEAEFDKNGTLNAKGLSVCKQGELQARNTQDALKACKDALVGEGEAEVEVAFPESRPFKAKGPLEIFNGGVKGGTTTLFAHVYVNVPAPTALVTPITVSKIHNGRYGNKVVAKIPVIAGGSGSTIHFSVTNKRFFTYKGKKQSYYLAKCPTGRFFAKGIAVFTNGTSLKGEVIRPCTPKG